MSFDFTQKCYVKKKLLNYPESKGRLFLEYIGLLLLKVIKYYKQAEFY